MRQEMRLTIRGHVQGVFFRSETQKKARQLGIRGFVQNQPDGSVIIVAHGEYEKLAQLKRWCAQGPKHARVDTIKEAWCAPSEQYRSFNIR